MTTYLKPVRYHCHYTEKCRGAAHSIFNLRYKVPRETPMVFHNGSTQNYHFIIKQLAEKFKGQFNFLEENAKIYITFSAPVYKENDNDKTINTNQGLLIAIDLCQPHYQILLITCQKLIIKTAKHAWRKKILNQDVILSNLKIIA